MLACQPALRGGWVFWSSCGGLAVGEVVLCLLPKDLVKPRGAELSGGPPVVAAGSPAMGCAAWVCKYVNPVLRGSCGALCVASECALY